MNHRNASTASEPEHTHLQGSFATAGPVAKDRGIVDMIDKAGDFVFGGVANKSFDMVVIFSKFYANTLTRDEQKVFNAYIKQNGFKPNTMPSQGTKFNPRG
jgi:hypothetical protein